MTEYRRFPVTAFAALLCVIVAGAAATASAYWPGFMTWDAIRQYDQATSGVFDDWHPPAMEWLWRQLGAIHAGPAPMLVLQLALEWGGLASLAGWALRHGRLGLAVAIVACGFMPFAFALTGEVLKDCLMAGALLVAVGALAWSDVARGRVGRVLIPVAGVGCLTLAATLRFNAFLATVPLCVALLPPTMWRTPVRRCATTLLACVLMVSALPVANRLVGAQPSGVALSLVIFDLGGITKYSGQDVFPPLAVADPVGTNAACYNPSQWDTYAWWTSKPCAIGFDTVRRAFEARGTSPYLVWLTAIVAHPIAYTEHRLGHFNINTRLFSRAPTERAVQIDPPPNDWGYSVTPTALLAAIDGAAVWSAATPLGWPVLWMALAFGVMILGTQLPSRRVVLPLAMSAVFYGLGYAVFSVASELRYHLWTIMAAAIATVITVADLYGGASVARPRLILAVAVPVAVLILAGGWRLATPG